MRRTLVLVLVVGSLAACHRSTSHRASSPPKLDVVLRDDGLTFSPAQLPADRYDISFHDRRAHRVSGQPVVLQFGPSGPLIALVSVPAGTERSGVLLANDIPWVLIDGVRTPVGGESALGIAVSDRYPTPAT